MLNGRYDTIIFDFDGTLAELTIDFEAMKRELFARARRVVPDAPDPLQVPALEWMHGLVARLSRSDAAKARALDKDLHAAVRAIEAAAAREGRLFPFTRPLLAALARKGVRTGIITRNCSDALFTVFPDAGDLAGVVLSRDDVECAKPDPRHIRAALKALDASPGRTLMVGDHMLDMETGRRAGVDAAGVLTGRCSRGDLIGAGAVCVAGDAGELFADVLGADGCGSGS